MGGVYSSYALVVSCDDAIINVKSLGSIQITKGYYIYVGSSNIRKPYLRVLRHLMRSVKKIKWHVDTLTTVCNPVAGLVCGGVSEDLLYRAFSSWGHATPLAKGFGCSDYRDHYTHLFSIRGVAGEGVYEVLRLIARKMLDLCSCVEFVLSDV
ncbi:MAG: DUF123 domain-containing protein [Zestosphaera sp.]